MIFSSVSFFVLLLLEKIFSYFSFSVLFSCAKKLFSKFFPPRYRRFFSKTLPKALLQIQVLTALTNLHILHNLLIQRQSGFNTSLYFPTRSFMRQGQTASVKNRQYSKSLLFRPIVSRSRGLPFNNLLNSH